jgi:hypothetical protein
MSEILKKLGYKDQDPILVINAPVEYKAAFAEKVVDIHTKINGKYSFIQVFETQLESARNKTAALIEALEEDGHLWVCYPKGTSKNYKSDINRTKIWDLFASYEFEPVTQVAINDDWSAIRYRHVDNISSMKRKTAATEKGKLRIKEKEDVNK